MDDFFIKCAMVIVSILIILTAMKIAKFIWNKVLYRTIVFFKPELKNIYDFIHWIIGIFKKKQPKNEITV